MGRHPTPIQRKKKDTSVLNMRAPEARAFFLKSESYCSVDLPPYFAFGSLLTEVSNVVSGKQLSSLSEKPRDHEGVNYTILSNKDGRHAWRPFQLIHPAIYVSLVEQITNQDRWELIRKRFEVFQKAGPIQCLSIPLQASAESRDNAAQIQNWWQGIEQRSIELSLKYDYMFHADIMDCYAAIYTHSIAWALHGKETAKTKRNTKRNDKPLIGNVIDGHIQDMRHGQTNGIPQGSVLMDFVAEMVLGYADLELAKRLKDEEDIDDYRILRYRDDYRILRYRDDYRLFVHGPQIGEAILKTLTEVLIDLGLKLNTTKTLASQQVVAHSLKPDKHAWLRRRQGDRNLQKHLLVIHAHGMDFPNAGSLTVALTHFHQRLSKVKQISNPRVLISIAVDIAYTSPRTFPVCAAIISKLLSVLDTDDERIGVIEKVYSKLSKLPNTGHMEIWLQRISHSMKPDHEYRENLCRLVKGEDVQVWKNDWIKCQKLKEAVDPSKIIQEKKLRALKPVVTEKEIAVFASERY